MPSDHTGRERNQKETAHIRSCKINISKQMTGLFAFQQYAQNTAQNNSKYFSTCAFVDFDNLQKPSSTIPGSSLTDCKSRCLYSPNNDCNHFTLSSTGTCTLMLGQYGSKVKTIYDDSANPNAFCGIIPTRYKPGTLL